MAIIDRQEGESEDDRHTLHEKLVLLIIVFYIMVVVVILTKPWLSLFNFGFKYILRQQTYHFILNYNV